MATPPKATNLDMLLEFVDGPVHTRKIILFDREWTILTDMNSFSAINLSGGDPTAIMQFLRSMIVAEEWPDFMAIASSHPALRGEEGGTNLVKIINAIVEVAGERPTKPSSISPRGGSGQTSGQKSAASSSATRVVRSIK